MKLHNAVQNSAYLERPDPLVEGHARLGLAGFPPLQDFD